MRVQWKSTEKLVAGRIIKCVQVITLSKKRIFRKNQAGKGKFYTD